MTGMIKKKDLLVWLSFFHSSLATRVGEYSKENSGRVLTIPESKPVKSHFS